MKNLKLRLKILLPTAVLFGTPWFHKMVYNNLLSAWPEMDHGAAHFAGLTAGVVAALITYFIAESVQSEIDRDWGRR